MKFQFVVIGLLCFIPGCSNSDTNPPAGQQQTDSQKSDPEADLARDNTRALKELLKKQMTPEEFEALNKRLDKMTVDEIQAENRKGLRELLKKQMPPEEFEALNKRLDEMTIDEIQAEDRKGLQDLLDDQKQENKGDRK